MHSYIYLCIFSNITLEISTWIWVVHKWGIPKVQNGVTIQNFQNTGKMGHRYVRLKMTTFIHGVY